MRSRLILLLAAAGVAAAAHAQPLTLLRYEARRFDASNNDGWGEHISAQPGDRIEVRAILSLSNPGTITGGIRQIIFQPVVAGGINWEAAGGDNLLTNSDLGLTDAAHPANGVGPLGGGRSTPRGDVADEPGAYGRITPWGLNAVGTSNFLRGHLGTGTAAGLLRIARAEITNWIGVGATNGPLAANNFNGGGGVNAAQLAADQGVLPTDPPYDPRQQNINVFKFAFVLSPTQLLPRQLSITTPAAGFGHRLEGSVYIDNSEWFIDDSHLTLSIVRTAAVANTALIDVVPAPGAAPLVGLGVLLAARRRHIAAADR